MPKILPVNYEDKFCYNINFQSSFNKLYESLIEIKPNKYDKICVVTDDIVEKYYLDDILSTLNDKFNLVITYIITNGEKSKQLSEVEKLYEELINHNFSRKDLLIALGGGVVGDMTGFCASTYLRGIDFIQIPTTLLSQVDSSIGGKTGVDFKGYKNMIGAFYMPKLVYINTSVLKTLSNDQFACGMGEVIKYGCIWDSNFYDFLKNNVSYILNKDDSVLEKMIYTCCDIKRQVVEIDPKEESIRSYLNFGHTIGHAIEKMSDFKLFHGQCVAIGMVSAMYLSVKKGWISRNQLDDLKDLLIKYNLPIKTSDISAKDVLLASKSDKKMENQRIKFIVLEKLGKAMPYMDFSDDELLDAISYVIEG